MANQHTKRREMEAAMQGFMPGDILTPPPAATEEPVTVVAALPIERDQDRWTINGKPIDPSLLHVIRYEMTDQWREANAHRLTDGPVARVTSDATDKRFDRYADADAKQVWEGGEGNPLDVTAREHRDPGERVRYLSDSVVKEKGLRGWRPKLDERGDPVKVGNLTLASMPEERAQKRDAYYQDLSGSRVQRIQEAHREQQDRLMYEAGITSLPDDSRIRDHGSSRVVSLGLHQTQGDIPTE